MAMKKLACFVRVKLFLAKTDERSAEEAFALFPTCSTKGAEDLTLGITAAPLPREGCLSLEDAILQHLLQRNSKQIGQFSGRFNNVMSDFGAHQSGPP